MTFDASVEQQPSAQYRLRRATSRDHLDQILRLRVEAWRTQVKVTSGITHWRDPHDDVGYHWAMFLGRKVVAAIRLTLHATAQDIPNYEVYVPALRSPLPTPAASYNRMVVDPKHRGRGLSAPLDQICISEARRLGAKVLVGATGSVVGNQHRIATMQRLGFVSLGEGAPYDPGLFDAGRPTILTLYL